MREALSFKDSDRQDKGDTELMRKEHRQGETISQGQSESERLSPTACKLSPQQQPPLHNLAPQSKSGKQTTGSESREVNPLMPPTQKHTTGHRSVMWSQVASFFNTSDTQEKSPHCFWQYIVI